MLKLLGPDALQMIHLNDYPATPPRSTITDALRVYPGDGIAPWGQIMDALHRSGFQGPLSLELFNRTYWKQDALQVAKTGLAKMRAVVQVHSYQERK
jgi:sugar phosphate isomerase/epimerase